MLDTNWVQPPFNIVRAAHAEYIVTDLEKARAFYVDLLGFVLSEETSVALYLRGYEERLHHSLVLRLGPTPAVDHVAFRVASPGDLDLLQRFYDAPDCPVRWVTAKEAGQVRHCGYRTRLASPSSFSMTWHLSNACCNASTSIKVHTFCGLITSISLYLMSRWHTTTTSEWGSAVLSTRLPIPQVRD